MSNLEELIRDTAAKGELNYLSLTPPDKVGGEWEAVYSPTSGFGHFIFRAKDPVEALRGAITGYRKPRKKSKPATETATEFG